jgi:hypothetical protein
VKAKRTGDKHSVIAAAATRATANAKIDRCRPIHIIRQPDVILVAFGIENEDRALLPGSKLYEHLHRHRLAKLPWRHGHSIELAIKILALR